MSNTEHPAHYNGTKYEVWDVLDAWFPACPLLWQVGKYIARADRKGAPIEDLEKAKVYLQREIDRRNANESVMCNGCGRKMPRTEGASIYCENCARDRSTL